ncbi:hypothetical protein QA601_07780 [Chitinispirillales bacterium ANBcel5]|uniref:hypothetical protein n=1 Tax=Cellulosispirillum alkaliphilum TaxID=3039283 RepID=UPI002A595F54|nr:hypothetical protein [Chitinispirillales bacterium ANBcel5]
MKDYTTYLLFFALVLAVQISYSQGFNSGAAITYTLHREQNPTEDQLDAYERIQEAMDSALHFYNTYTTITKTLTVYYNPDVATADANFNSTIRFGANRSYMVVATAMHEIAHTVGVGTTREYRELVRDGVFTGSYATAELRDITGDPDAVLNADNQHFWPYGLNYAHEAQTEQDLINHCRIVNALYKDLFNEEFRGNYRLYSTVAMGCMVPSESRIVIGSCSDSASLFRLVSLGDSVYRIEFGSGVLDIPGESAEAGLGVGVWSWNGGDHQRVVFEHQESEGDLFRLRMLHSGHYLRANDDSVIQDRAHIEAETQYWILSGEDSLPSTALGRTVKSKETVEMRGNTLLLNDVWKLNDRRADLVVTDSRGRSVVNRMVKRGSGIHVGNLSNGVYIIGLTGERKQVIRLLLLR